MLGAILAKAGYGVVYGGSRAGLMGLVADGALAQGGKVIGVIPAFLVGREQAHTDLNEQYVVETMHERQMKMADLSDAFIVLPGGLGTMAEFFEVATWKTLGVYNKPVIVVNLRGYWDPILKMIESAGELGFLHHMPENLFYVVDSVNNVCAILDEIGHKE